MTWQPPTWTLADTFNDKPHPIRRDICLAMRFFDDDPAPARCRLKFGHDGDHAALLVGASMNLLSMPVPTWERVAGEDDEFTETTTDGSAA